MNLQAELQREISNFSTDDNKLRETLDFVRKLNRRDKKKSHATPPCQYTIEELKQRAEAALEAFDRGEYYTTEDMLKRTERWK